jgi:hypothetical protein
LRAFTVGQSNLIKKFSINKKKPSILPTTVKNEANFTGIRSNPDAKGKFYPCARWAPN